MVTRSCPRVVLLCGNGLISSRALCHFAERAALPLAGMVVEDSSREEVTEDGRRTPAGWDSLKGFLIRGWARANPYYRALFKETRAVLRDYGLELPPLPAHNPRRSVFWVRDRNSSETVEVLRKLAPDLILIAGVGILKEEVLASARWGVLNCHPAKLPEVRGYHCVLRSLAAGIPLATSVHWVNPRVDAGPILSVRDFPLRKGDTLMRIEIRSEVEAPRHLVEAARDFLEGRTVSSMINTGGTLGFRRDDSLFLRIRARLGLERMKRRIKRSK